MTERSPSHVSASGSRPGFLPSGGKKFSRATCLYAYEELFTPQSAGLEFLSCGLHSLRPEGRSPHWAHPREETLLFNAAEASVSIQVSGRKLEMAHYDSLYVPRGQEYFLSAKGEASLYEFRAPAENDHPSHLSKWQEISASEKRIRRMKGKDVYIMFDVSEKADRLVAGYTFFQAHQRGWPPHNHTDQEEVYLFIEGRGAMEVYYSEEEKTFVTGVEAGDAIAIPRLAFHPPFSQDQEMAFIWCIAGARYWVGDRSEQFMRGEGQSVTT